MSSNYKQREKILGRVKEDTQIKISPSCLSMGVSLFVSGSGGGLLRAQSWRELDVTWEEGPLHLNGDLKGIGGKAAGEPRGEAISTLDGWKESQEEQIPPFPSKDPLGRKPDPCRECGKAFRRSPSLPGKRPQEGGTVGMRGLGRRGFPEREALKRRRREGGKSFRDRGSLDHHITGS